MSRNATYQDLKTVLVNHNFPALLVLCPEDFNVMADRVRDVQRDDMGPFFKILGCTIRPSGQVCERVDLSSERLFTECSPSA